MFNRKHYLKCVTNKTSLSMFSLPVILFLINYTNNIIGHAHRKIKMPKQRLFKEMNSSSRPPFLAICFADRGN